MTAAQWFAYVILPGLVALIGLVGSRIFEDSLRKDRRSRNEAAHDLKAAE